jgi:hypothetical protein
VANRGTLAKIDVECMAQWSRWLDACVFEVMYTLSGRR